ncbi:hypothetical protein DOTSEDRAFT_67940 [Dothistroma septosporum NZE10]|uniref:Casein kinase II subunit beta n=1 Tax=Dothistroma septosporum (strain NZE10 / CBS 128990) TaxID=675120 RepID=N1PZX5_DOTSN|nr:hypothetical protein DOTSEDRAFT_67940 [Dothistroma septosporum NZE10]
MSSSSQAPESWISAFCSLVGHEYFAEVSEDFVEDDFNLTGLQSQVPMYKEALEMILDVEPEDASEEEEEEEEEDEEDEDEDEMQDGVRGGYRRAADAAAAAAERRHLRMASDLSVIESSAEMLYGLIHQRFITSRPGIQQMAEKYELGHFGHCPRVFCHGAKVLPVGCSDIPGQETVKLFCPSCLDVYSPPNSRFQTVDGAFFGTTFGCLFFMTFPELDIGGQKPAIQQLEPSVSASSPLSGSTAAQNSSIDKTSRGSLSSSLTSQQPNVLPPRLGDHTAVARQPDQINGVAPRNLAPGLGKGNVYEPRIYGFRVSEIAKTGPRMKWLRERPENVIDLDECAIWAQNQTAMMNDAAVAPAEAGFGDSEMADDNQEIDEGEVEDQDMDVSAAAAVRSNDQQVQEVTQRRKPSVKKQRHHQTGPGAMVNGDLARSVVRVGDGD